MKRYLLPFLAISLSLVGLAHTFRIQNGDIDLNDLPNYANQSVPDYIIPDNTPGDNPITDKGATLGRVLFYDARLSINDSISCSSCHMQSFGFSDTAQLSRGWDGGLTGRHSMRLVNARFGEEVRFFWDERASSLEDQSTQPIQDHIEMGFSGGPGEPDLDSLLHKMENIAYYPPLFLSAFGTSEITEERMQRALAQFVRSIQSFDSKYDAGRAQVQGNAQPFPNFTAQENMGKQLFMQPAAQGGAGCQGCHRAPTFDIDPNTLNNGVIEVAGNETEIDLTNTRAPSLRDLVNPNGQLNGPMMHNGAFNSIAEVIEHYNEIPPNPQNSNIDPRLNGGPMQNGQNLNLTDAEKAALEAFLLTLTGTAVYTDERWSSPFDASGGLNLLNATSTSALTAMIPAKVHPNPFAAKVNISCSTCGDDPYRYFLHDLQGKLLRQGDCSFAAGMAEIETEGLAEGAYVLSLHEASGRLAFIRKIIRR